MKRVVELITFLNDAGAENLIKNYCLNIDKQKFEIIVVTLFDYHTDCVVYQSIKKAGVKIIPVYNADWKKSELQEKILNWGNKNPSALLKRVWNRFFSDNVQKFLQAHFEKKTAKKLSKLLKGINPDVIHAHLHVQNVLRWTKIRKNVDLIYTCHSEPYRYFSGNEYKNTKYLLDKKHMRLIALHNDMQKKINELFNINDTIQLNNWIDFSRFRNVSESQSDIRKSFNISENVFVIGTIGRIVEYKNQIFLIDVLKDIISMGVYAVLVIAGQGDFGVKSQILNRAKEYGIEERVLFLGVRNDVERLYKMLDVFMLPSLFEGLSMVAVEAQVSGKNAYCQIIFLKQVC